MLPLEQQAQIQALKDAVLAKRAIDPQLGRSHGCIGRVFSMKLRYQGFIFSATSLQAVDESGHLTRTKLL